MDQEMQTVKGKNSQKNPLCDFPQKTWVVSLV